MSEIGNRKLIFLHYLYSYYNKFVITCNDVNNSQTPICPLQICSLSGLLFSVPNYSFVNFLLPISLI